MIIRPLVIRHYDLKIEIKLKIINYLPSHQISNEQVDQKLVVKHSDTGAYQSDGSRGAGTVDRHHRARLESRLRGSQDTASELAGVRHQTPP